MVPVTVQGCVRGLGQVCRHGLEITQGRQLRWPLPGPGVALGLPAHLQLVAIAVAVHPEPASLRKLWQARWKVHSMSALTWPRSRS